MQNEAISLYFSEGSSDKEYHCELVAKDDGFVVNFRYGRRGTALTAGTKTAAAVPYAKAKVIYDKLVKEKMGKGYSPGEAGSAYQDTTLEARFTGLVPQLLNAIDGQTLRDLLGDKHYAMQAKLDGKRIFIRRTVDGVEGANRRGLVVALPQVLARIAAALPAGTVVDGELIGEVFHAFDLLEYGGSDLRGKSYFERAAALKSALKDAGLSASAAIREVPIFTGNQKQGAFETIKAEKGEGVVFKRLDAPYTAGRPASGGAQLKYKFVESATCRVLSGNIGKRSVKLELMNEKAIWVSVGNVTIPPNYAIPKDRAIVEVQYLYAYKDGSLYQPIYKGTRDDQDVAACRTSQLKYKSESSEDEDT